MRAFLRGKDGSGYQILSKLTTVGCDGCDITLQTNGLDAQHAVIEYVDQEKVYVLKDLNTAQGTYVNDCRIQNAAIRLAPGDIIKFGYTGVPHEFVIETSAQFSCPPVQQQQAWSQPLTLLQEVVGEQSHLIQPQMTLNANQVSVGYNQNAALPYLATGTATLTIPSTVWTPANERNTLPRPPMSLRNRPASAGSVRRVGAFDRVQTVGGSPVSSPLMQRGSTNGWVNGSTSRQAYSPHVTQNADIPKIQEKEQKIMQMNEEIKRLREIEIEALRKDAHIQTLQQTVSDMQQRLCEHQPLVMGQDVNLTQRIIQLENELTSKEQEINSMRDQLSNVQSLHQDHSASVVSNEEKVKELSVMKTELERAKKDKNITSGLVTQMQKDMASKSISPKSKDSQEISSEKTPINSQNVTPDPIEQIQTILDFKPISPQNQTCDTAVSAPIHVDMRDEKILDKVSPQQSRKGSIVTPDLVEKNQNDDSFSDTTISRLSREIETLRKEVRERDIQLTSVSSKLSKSKDTPLKSTDERDAREKELISLRQKFKTTENKMQEQQELINSLKQELEKSKLSIYDEKSLQKKLETQIEQVKSELLDVQRTERVVRVDLEQATKRLERFRNRVVQTTYSSQTVKAPEGEITDDEMMETLKKIVEERTEFQRRVKEVEDQIKRTDSSSNVFKTNITKLRTELEKTAGNLKENGFLANCIKHEVSLLQSVTGDESIIWMRDCLVEMLNNIMSWEQEIENSLEKCGINIKLSNQAPGKHIETMHANVEQLHKEKEQLESRLSNVEDQFKSELELKVKVMNEECENKIKDEVEKARCEGEERLTKAIEEIKIIEAEKRENAIAEEQKKLEELQATIEQLRLNLQEKQQHFEERLQEASVAVTQVEEYKLLQAELEEKIRILESEKESLSAQITAEVEGRDKKYEEDVQAYKEQNKQHSVTICAMEERLIKLMKKNKDYQEEIAELKKTMQEMKNELLRLREKSLVKPAPPPKPKVIIQKPTEDLAAMEQLIVVLRKENSDLKNTLQSRDDVILGLRRDLTGAHARLSDITGELSESQKQEIEKNKEKLIQREQEITGLRQQMAKLSKIIDKQKDEIRSLEKSLSEEKAISVKFKSTMDERDRRIKELEILLEQEKLEQKKQLDLLDQEGRITSELTALGAQCRGERHEQVISRQREALAELRLRCKSLEQAKPPLPTQDQALQQVIMLKKELSEIKANQALSENSELSSGLNKEVSRARGLLGSVNAEADMERSAHRETMDALEASESSYMVLLRAMASCLEMESVEGLRPIGHIPKDERERLIIERENTCQVLANRIKVLKERIARKEELLQGYERDLTKMRQAQELAAHKASQVDSLANDVKSRTEETQYLRESLNRTRDRLDQEKRLNKAIKQRKTFHLENERLHQQQTPASHHCKPEDVFGKNSARAKSSKEALRRKAYEINTLKQELCNKEQTLFDTENRLYTLENTIGMERQREQEIIES